jgi:uncharacterized protein (DUF1684 family)
MDRVMARRRSSDQALSRRVAALFASDRVHSGDIDWEGRFPLPHPEVKRQHRCHHTRVERWRCDRLWTHASIPFLGAARLR